MLKELELMVHKSSINSWEIEAIAQMNILHEIVWGHSEIFIMNAVHI